MLIDIHNHTYLCNHADGTALDYAQKAYDLGCKFYGFSDHAPMKFDEKYRMKFSQMQQYKQMIDEVKTKFSGKMEVLFGYEVDFMSDSNLMDERVLSAKCDFLIGSVHFIDGWGFDNPEFIGKYKDMDMDLVYEKYFEIVENMVKSNKFNIVGHLDLIKVFGFKSTKDIRQIAKNAINAIQKSKMVVELNTAGLRKPANEIYPSEILLQMIAERNIDITLCSDAHSIDQVGLNMPQAINLARKFGYTKAAIFKEKQKILVNF